MCVCVCRLKRSTGTASNSERIRNDFGSNGPKKVWLWLDENRQLGSARRLVLLKEIIGPLPPLEDLEWEVDVENRRTRTEERITVLRKRNLLSI